MKAFLCIVEVHIEISCISKGPSKSHPRDWGHPQTSVWGLSFQLSIKMIFTDSGDLYLNTRSWLTFEVHSDIHSDIHGISWSLDFSFESQFVWYFGLYRFFFQFFFKKNYLHIEHYIITKLLDLNLQKQSVGLRATMRAEKCNWIELVTKFRSFHLPALSFINVTFDGFIFGNIKEK